MGKDPKEAIRQLVEGFHRNIRVLKSPGADEATIRQEYIDKFWRLLGWDVGNEKQRPYDEKEVVIEKSMEVREGPETYTCRPDYTFLIDTHPRFVVEAKKPIEDLKRNKHHIYQAKTYAWNATIPFAVLMDFEEFRLFDTTIQPDFEDPERGVVRDFDLRYEKYADLWDVIAATFGRDAVEGGSLDRLFAQTRKVRAGRRLRTVDRMLIDIPGSVPVDRAFLSFLEGYRVRFAKDIYAGNKAVFPDADTRHGAAKLTEAVQRLLDRLVFLRVCEDRHIATYGSLRSTLEYASAERLDLYGLLVTRFRERNLEFNGYLFREHFSDGLAVSGELLSDFIRSLYPTQGPYRFDAIGDDILGIVYERFLGNVVTARGGRAVVEEKPEVRHAGGVYYTPRFVVESIVRRVVGPKIKGLTPKEVLKVKILDPACGSGSFLVAAYQFLLKHCIRYLAEHPEAAKSGTAKMKGKKSKDIGFQADGEWHLAPDFRAELLTSCIFGVDIDAQAVEVTMMSLYLKMLEARLPKNWQADWVENRLLPPLDSNIRCGNSLISPDDFDRWWDDKHGGLFPGDEDTKFRINAFEWRSRTHGFGQVIGADGGFDCVIGNPPYIRVQELNKWAAEECEFYKWRFKSAAAGNFDIYVVFVERGLSLLDRNGSLGFIMPHKFWQAAYGAELRRLLVKGKNIRAIVDFGDQQVFKGATTYTAIQVFGRSPSEAIDYAKVLALDDGEAICRAFDAGRVPPETQRYPAAQPPSAEPWFFVSKDAARVMEQMDKVGVPLGAEPTHLFVGLQTSADEVFILDRRGREFFSPALDKTVPLEPDLLHPMLKGSVHMRRWVPDATEQVVVFPYREEGGDWDLIPEAALRKEAPKCWKYLESCREILAKRERGRFEGPGWYGFVYPKNLGMMDQPKILAPALGKRSEFCLDPKGRYYFVGSGGGGGGGYGIVLENPMEMEFLLGVLNSRLLDWYLKAISTPFQGGWYAYNKQYIERLPIKWPETGEEKALATKVRDTVRTLLPIVERLRSPDLGDREKERLEREIEAHEGRIDEAVFGLYGVEPSRE